MNPHNLRRSPRQPDTRPAWLSVGSTTTQVEIKDVSKEGACLLSPRPVAAGRTISYQLGPREAGDVFEGVVVRCDSALSGTYEIAVCHMPEPGSSGPTRP